MKEKQTNHCTVIFLLSGWEFSNSTSFTSFQTRLAEEENGWNETKSQSATTSILPLRQPHKKVYKQFHDAKNGRPLEHAFYVNRNSAFFHKFLYS